MKPRIKFGLLLGISGLTINICTAGLLNFILVGPILIGWMAGMMAAREEKLPDQLMSAQAGAVAGALAGVLSHLSLIVFMLGILVFSSPAEVESLFGRVPTLANPFSSSFLNWFFLANLGGMLLTTGAGAFSGYRAWVF